MLEEAHTSVGSPESPLSHICSVVLRKVNHCVILDFSFEDEPQKRITPLTEHASPNATSAHFPLVWALKLWDLS